MTLAILTAPGTWAERNNALMDWLDAMAGPSRLSMLERSIQQACRERFGGFYQPTDRAQARFIDRILRTPQPRPSPEPSPWQEYLDRWAA